MFTTARLIAPLAATLFVAVPAFAAPYGTAAKPIAAEEVAVAAAAASAAAATNTEVDRSLLPSQRYCIVSNVTGSRIPRKECATLGAWRGRGIDPSVMPRRSR